MFQTTKKFLSLMNRRKKNMTDFNDADESYCAGDTPPEDIDWARVEYLQERYDEIHTMPEGEEKSMAMLTLLSEMHGPELEVL